jgi:hypothetical protein
MREKNCYYTLKLKKVMLSLSWIKKNTMQRLIDDGPYELMTSNPLIRMVESAKNMIREMELEDYESHKLLEVQTEGV